MSVRVMAQVWDTELPAGEKLVLLALADCANDEGKAWPGMRTLCQKTGKGERSIQGAIKALEKEGHLTRKPVVGKGCFYFVHPRNKCAPAENAPPQKTTPAPAEIAGKPSGTVNDNNKDGWVRPDWADEQHYADFMRNRKTRRLTNSPTSYQMFLNDIDKHKSAEWPPWRLLEYAAGRGWGSINKPSERQYGQASSGSRNNDAFSNFMSRP